MAICDITIKKDIAPSCDDPIVPGLEQEGVIMNRAEVDFGAVTFNTTRKNVIEALALKTGKKGYKVQVFGATPFTGTNTTLATGTYRNTFTNTVNMVVLANDPDVCNDIIDGLANGDFVVVLANIYLDKFDKYMNEYANKFNKGTVRSRNKDICKLNSRVHYLKRRINEVKDANERTRMVEELHEKQKRILTMPSGNDMDRNFRRLRYVRYADDFLIGVIGTKNECETIKADITKFMREKLRLEMSQEKTLITNAQDSAKFLGYEIYVRKDYATKRNSNGTVRRHFNGNVILHVSREAIKNKLLSLEAMKVVTKHGKETWVSKGRTYMIDNEAHEIVSQFNTEIRGFYNYYSIANNASALGRSFGCIMKFSMYKTLAQKLNMSVRKVIETYRKDNLFAVPFVNKRGETKYRVFYNEGYARKTDCETAPSDNLPYMFKTPSLSLIERLTTKKCELCGKHGEVVMHHVRTLKELKGKNDWERKMLYMHRKTLVVCAECNAKIQSCDK